MTKSAVENYTAVHSTYGSDSAVSGVSWAAIFAGAFAAAALSFILVILGFGLGFSSVSPWSETGLSAQTIGYSTIAWITFTQISASAIGGYMAGRLRVKWVNLHNGEVYFRDTAHGFLAWAVASLATVVMLSSAISSIISGGTKLAGSVGAAAVATVGAAGIAADTHNSDGKIDSVSGYVIDQVFRTSESRPNDHTATNSTTSADTHDNAVTPAQRMEVTRIFSNAIQTGRLPDADKTYVGQMLAKRTGMSQSEAEKRVSDLYGNYKKTIDDGMMKVKQGAEQARKAADYSALWLFVSMLCGAFIASFSATFGGRQRDREMITG